jgi:hypothetical protein
MILNEKGLLESKDQCLNILLIALGFEIKERIRGKHDGKMYLCYENTPEVQDLADRWRRNLPIPTKDVRQFFQGEEIYRSNLHAHLDEVRSRR